VTDDDEDDDDRSESRQRFDRSNQSTLLRRESWERGGILGFDLAISVLAMAIGLCLYGFGFPLA